MTNMEAAYKEYSDRQNKVSNPKVHYSNFFENAEIAQSEHMPCCDDYLDKNATAINRHLRSMRHVAYMFGVNYKEFRRYATFRRIEETRNKRRNLHNTWNPDSIK